TAQVVGRAGVIRVDRIGLVGEGERIRVGKPREVVDVPVGVVPHDALPEPDRTLESQVLGERLLIRYAGHTRVPHLHVGEEPLLGDQQGPHAVRIDSPTFQHQRLSLRTHRHHGWSSGELRDRAADPLVLKVVLVLRPTVETPPHPFEPFGSVDAGGPGVPKPDAIRGDQVEAAPGEIHVVRSEHLDRLLAHFLVLDEDLDALVPVQHADDLGVHPWDRFELARPVRLVVRPADPGGGVRLPFRGPAPGSDAAHPMYRFRIGPYASMRRSRRKGQLRRVYSIRAGSHSATRTSGSVPASAIILPNGSQMNEWPKNSIPSVPGSGSWPTRLAAAT